MGPLNYSQETLALNSNDGEAFRHLHNLARNKSKIRTLSPPAVHASVSSGKGVSTPCCFSSEELNDSAAWLASGLNSVHNNPRASVSSNPSLRSFKTAKTYNSLPCIVMTTQTYYETEQTEIKTSVEYFPTEVSSGTPSLVRCRNSDPSHKVFYDTTLNAEYYATTTSEVESTKVESPKKQKMVSSVFEYHTLERASVASDISPSVKPNSSGDYFLTLTEPTPPMQLPDSALAFERWCRKKPVVEKQDCMWSGTPSMMGSVSGSPGEVPRCLEDLMSPIASSKQCSTRAPFQFENWSPAFVRRDTYGSLGMHVSKY